MKNRMPDIFLFNYGYVLLYDVTNISKQHGIRSKTTKAVDVLKSIMTKSNISFMDRL